MGQKSFVKFIAQLFLGKSHRKGGTMKTLSFNPSPKCCNITTKCCLDFISAVAFLQLVL